MLGFIHGTVLGAWLVHVLLISPWVIGITILLAPLLLIANGFPIVGTSILGVFLLQYVYPLSTWPAFRKMMRELNPRGYYKKCELTLVDGANLRDTSSMLCYHPHGVICAGFSWTGCHHPEFSEGRHGDVAWLISGSLCELPFFKLAVKWMGNIFPVSKPVMTRLMNEGRNISLVPGGFQEATIMKAGCERIFLKKRMGFITYALRFGYRVHPCCSFGENHFFWIFQPVARERPTMTYFRLVALARPRRAISERPSRPKPKGNVQGKWPANQDPGSLANGRTVEGAEPQPARNMPMCSATSLPRQSERKRLR